MTKNWHLDIGINNVGWTATDKSYNVFNINNKRLIGGRWQKLWKLI